MRPELKGGLQVLMTADTLGGVWDYSLELAARLTRHGVQVTLATMGNPVSGPQRAAASAIPNLRLAESSFRLEWMPEAGLDVARAGRWLLQLEQKLQPDLIHLNGYWHAALPWQAPCLVVGHSCVLSWWAAVKKAAPPEEWREYGRRVRQGLQAADLVVAPSRAMLRELEHHYGKFRHSLVIPNGREPRFFHPRPKRPFLFSAGRVWDEAKNIGGLAAVASSLDWPVLAAGEWRRPEGGGTPPPHLHCLGVLPPVELAEWLGRAAVYVLPACYEPFGLSVLEAGLSGCALVLGDIPSQRELWDGAALFVEPGNRHALQKNLQRLISDRAERERLGRAARQRALTYHSGKMAAAYLEEYGKLLQSGRRSERQGSTGRPALSSAATLSN